MLLKKDQDSELLFLLKYIERINLALEIGNAVLVENYIKKQSTK